MSIEKVLGKYERIKVNEGYAKLLINGVRVGDSRFTDNPIKSNKIYRVYDENEKFQLPEGFNPCKDSVEGDELIEELTEGLDEFFN